LDSETEETAAHSTQLLAGEIYGEEFSMYSLVGNLARMTADLPVDLWTTATDGFLACFFFSGTNLL
jgi:hypothetical protein